MDPILFIKIISGVFGALIGSFLNAVIYRIPREISIIKKQRSHCPQCDSVIKWYQNIPMLSFVLLKRKCANCEFKIPIRYFLIEVFMAFVFVFLAPLGLEPIQIMTFLFQAVVASCFVAHFFIDVDSQLLPDSINFVLGVFFLAFGIFELGWKTSLIGGIVGFSLPFGVTWLFYKIKGQIGLGGGDIKLFTALGFYLGAAGIFQNLFLSCFVGSIIGISAILIFKHKKDNPMAFGPAIIITSTFQIFFPEYFGQLMKFFFGR